MAKSNIHEEILKLVLNSTPRIPNRTLIVPPPVAAELQGIFLEYIPKKKLICQFPVLEKFTNPAGALQGGIISAAFDNVFGPLSYLTAGKPTASLDLNTNYIRSIKSGDEMIITALVVSRGASTLHMSGEAKNRAGKLVATSVTNMVIFKV